eukprot:3464326-Rhodomonas_salina.1
MIRGAPGGCQWVVPEGPWRKATSLVPRVLHVFWQPSGNVPPFESGHWDCAFENLRLSQSLRLSRLTRTPSCAFHLLLRFRPLETVPGPVLWGTRVLVWDFETGFNFC